jgi:uncharacterized protein (TIGR03437 family)
MGFTADSTVQWNGLALQTNVISPTELNAVIPSSLVSNANQAAVSVTDSAGNITNYLPFSVLQSPSLSAIVSSASFKGNVVSPGEIVSLFGDALTTGVIGILSADALPLPTSISGTSVVVNGIPAPLFAVSNIDGTEQVNFMIPFEVQGSSLATVALLNSGSESVNIQMPIQESHPAIYTIDGHSAIAVHSDGTTLVSAMKPTVAGETIVFYAAGLGALSPSLATNQPAPSAPLSRVAAGCSMSIGGRIAEVQFCGATPTLVGLYQLNVLVPSGVSSGAADVILQVGSQTAETVSIQVE